MDSGNDDALKKCLGFDSIQLQHLVRLSPPSTHAHLSADETRFLRAASHVIIVFET